MSRLNPREISQIQGHLTKTPRPNLLNPLLRTLSRQNPSKALHLYAQLLHPISNHLTFTYALKASSSHPLPPSNGLQVHAHLTKTLPYARDLFLQNSLINFYSYAADLSSSRKLFDEMSDRDIVSWTSIVSGLSRHGRAHEALALFASMDLKPNALTIVASLPACSALSAVRLGKSVHGYGLKAVGPHGSNVILDNAVLDMYFTCGDLGYARRLFGAMPDRDVVSWTTAIAGCLRNGKVVEAIDGFVSMRRDGDVMPNDATLVTVLTACASMGGSLRVGRLVHSYLFTSGFAVNTVVGNALVNMYAKCGEIGMAFVVFERLQCKDFVSWCTIIRGLAVNGRAEAALQSFALMLCHGLVPDVVAFLAVLSACCHAGLVEQSLSFFMAMREVYGVDPQKEHYSCLIDTFGRSGRLEEAEELVRNLPVDVDVQVLGGLLSACRMHCGERAMVGRVGERVLNGEVSAGGGTYALISNMMAKDGRWDEATGVREQMESRRIVKTAGCSWIEVCRSEKSG